MPAERPRLRKREIAFAVAAGALAAGGAALVLDEDVGPDRRHEQIEAAGEVAYPATGFDQVLVIGPQDVDIVYADGFKVTASGSPEALAGMEAVVEGGRLVIRPKDGNALAGTDMLEDVSFTIAMPRITRVELAGSGDVTLDRVSGEAFAGQISGSGSLSIGEVQVEQASFTVAGSGDLDASGEAAMAAISIEGSGEVHAGGLSAGQATVAITGSGEADLTALQTANVSITGSGTVDISGPALCSVTRLGGGEVRCEGGGDED